MTDYEPRKVWSCTNHKSGQIPCPNCVPVSVENIPDHAQDGSEALFAASKLPSGKDDVRSPSHYTVGGIETIDYMAAKATPDEFKGHLRLTALKYLSRAGHKDDALKDYKKARVYLDWLINHLETGDIRRSGE